MTRAASLAATTIGLGLMGLLVASPAHANISNPADNPHKVTVVGDDGNTYVDGQDTLPGFDDIACTYIPGAYFDFDNNKVIYPDGQSITWTEWDRATGYKDWQAAKNAAAPAAAPAPAAAASSTGTSGSGAAAPAAGGTKPASGATEVKADGATAADPSANATATPSASAGAEADPADSEDSTEAAADRALAQGDSGSQGENGGSSAGLAILAGLFGVGGLAFGGYTFLRRGSTVKAS